MVSLCQQVADVVSIAAVVACAAARKTIVDEEDRTFFRRIRKTQEGEKKQPDHNNNSLPERQRRSVAWTQKALSAEEPNRLRQEMASTDKQIEPSNLTCPNSIQGM